MRILKLRLVIRPDRGEDNESTGPSYDRSIGPAGAPSITTISGQSDNVRERKGPTARVSVNRSLFVVIARRGNGWKVAD